MQADIAPTNAVRMNFHDAPLNTVLNYLSKKMGFVVVSDAEVHGDATIVSEQPVGTNEVMELLSGALAKNNYAVSRNGRILTITTADTAKTGPLTPVNHPQSPAEIPVNDEMATDVLPVHTLNPTQLVKDLSELVPPGASLQANEAGNAVDHDRPAEGHSSLCRNHRRAGQFERVRGGGFRSQIRRRQIGSGGVEGNVSKPGFDRWRGPTCAHGFKAGGFRGVAGFPALAGEAAAVGTTTMPIQKTRPTKPSSPLTTR